MTRSPLVSETPRNTDYGPALAVVGADGVSLTTLQHPLEKYQINNYTDGTAPNYYGYESSDGAWYIKKIDDSSSPVAVTYSAGSSSYATAWTNRASQTYGTFATTF